MWWRNRTLLWAFIRRDLQEKLAGSVLGPLTLFLQPLVQILVFVFLFKYVFKVRIRLGGGLQEDFMRFFLTGFIPWSIHAEAVMRGSSSLLAQGHLLTKAAFPAEILPVSATVSAYILGLPALAILAVVLFLTGPLDRLSLLAPLWLGVQFVFSLGVVFLFAAVLVYLRDLQQFMGSIMMIWFYATPILYSTEMLPEKIRPFLWFNPFTYFTLVWQGLFLEAPLNGRYLVLSLAGAFLSLTFGWWFFHRCREGFADVL